MKRALSCIYPALRATLLPLLLILLISGAAQAALFARTLSAADVWAYPIYYETSYREMIVYPSFADVVENAHLSLAFSVTLLLVCAVLYLHGCDFSGKSGYTLGRLEVDDRMIALLQAGYNALCIALLLLFEAVLCRFLGSWFMGTRFGDAAGNQGLMLSFYLSDFLHSLVPLEEWSRLVRNAVLCMCLGTSASFFSFKQRYSGKIAYSAILAAALAARMFAADMGSFGAGMFLCAMLIMLTAACAIDWNGGGSV